MVLYRENVQIRPVNIDTCSLVDEKKIGINMKKIKDMGLKMTFCKIQKKGLMIGDSAEEMQKSTFIDRIAGRSGPHWWGSVVKA